ncbi:SRPBCC family protein [Bacillus nakamurai]|uniref:SRPBCC family protein n=1 Tax=Bacillus nakamurai TaxID=1793963 RepID=UPI001E417B02|nr:SRPBCC domain-containing protein [Bacillus nakamurai]MCC9024352.1 SRPBCC domain-containing protein [Bacillus nakamurai]MCP6684017.1 SRPBCC domain-containing protein [Bacillus nakamurai]
MSDKQNSNTELPDITHTVVLKAPMQVVWDTVSTADGLALWFMPNDFTPEEGSEFQLESPFGPSPCKLLDIDPPYRLSFSWDTEGWIVSFVLKEMENGDTEFTLIHGGWKKADEVINKVNQKSSDIHSTMDNGWKGLVNEKLRAAVEA